MKSFIYGLILVMGLCGMAMAADSGLNANFSSGNKTDDAVIRDKPSVVKQVFIYTDGTSCSVALYNHASAASGTVIFPAIPCIGANGGCTTDVNVYADTGVYADMTLVGGTTCTYNVHYR